MWNAGSLIVLGAVLMMAVWLVVWWRTVVRPANAHRTLGSIGTRDARRRA
jgi:hypothetical protein